METKRVARRKHSKEFRAEFTQACREPRASVAAITLRSGLNANVVYRWLREDPGADTGVHVDAGSLTVMGGRPGAPEFDSSAPQNLPILNGINRLAALFEILVVARFKP